ncbi:tigger transposable element-derived protein 6-like [Ylistrum balloti]|uniref:tigger transposable element-derived protein 6-like n=1 Tax=Ylistrum balloti TaxID=509963 RepID=UPI0029059B23|nr:tigger transposable element-derived protein 6-like [Ylistrum balloti]
MWCQNGKTSCQTLSVDMMLVTFIIWTKLAFSSGPYLTSHYVFEERNARKGRSQKDRITFVLCCNLEGNFEKPLIIGKSLNPRCFKNIRPAQLPVTWRTNKKAWMTGQLFRERVTDLDRRMRLARRHILLFLDNALSHPSLKLTNIKLVFFPVNTTSVLQPLDQGIIQTVKVVNCKRLFRSTIARLGDGNHPQEETFAKGITILDAIRFVSGVVNDVKKETIVKCFAKGGISVSDVAVVETDCDTPQMCCIV